jgi:flagellin-like hook-associated protein FlgL
MSSIVLSASVRQNLLSLQSTADLLATTQQRLSTGKKVNTALDNPTNFFTAQGLDNRASDISNLLDGINNGVQVLQAANTGITSLQKLIDSAKSIANQALQTTVGYSTKSNVSTTIPGATPADLRGTTSFTSAIASSNVLYDGTVGGTTAAALTTTLGGAAGTLTGTASTGTAYVATAGTAGTQLKVGTANAAAQGTDLISALTNGAVATPTGPAAGDVITINGHTLSFTAAGAAAQTGTTGDYTIGVDQTITSLLSTINTLTGGTSAINGTGQITLTTGTGADIAASDNTSGATLTKLGLNAAASNTITRTTTPVGAGSITAATKLFGATAALATSSPYADGDTFTVNGKSITFKTQAVPGSLPTGSSLVGSNVVTDGSGNSTIYLGASTASTNVTVGDVLGAIDLASGVAYNNGGTVTANAGQTLSSIAAGVVTLKSSTGSDLSLSGKADLLKGFGLTTSSGGGIVSVTAPRVTGPSSLASLVQSGSTLNVDGKVITFKDAPTPTAASVGSTLGVSGNVVTDGNGNSTVYLQQGTVADVLRAIDFATGVQTFTLNGNGSGTLATAAGQANSTIAASGALKISTGINADLAITSTGNALPVLGLAGNTGTASAFTAPRNSGVGGVSGKTLTFSSFNGGTPVNVTFGDGTNGTVKTLNQLNVALQANHMTATIDANGVLTVTTVNEFASSTLGSTTAGGAIGGTITGALTFSTAQPPVEDPVAQTARANLVSQFNNILQQIDTTSQDASFNGVNLLNGDTLKLVFNETGSSTLGINGVVFNAAGLGLSSLVSGTDFIDNGATNRVLTSLNAASSTLRSQASALGSNLSIVQVRQDFSKNLINVLQTGSSNLTLADTNEEAANSQALSTRQSIAVSALSLANQSQQSVLQLLR